MNLILASGSPRRINMMKEKGYDPAIMPADVNENLPFDMNMESAVMYLALKKALWVEEQIKTEDTEDIAND
jgi:predicted house-cleaning NTP pyrophosphatase (Maf/HAM1 superfamily)